MVSTTCRLFLTCAGTTRPTTTPTRTAGCSPPPRPAGGSVPACSMHSSSTAWTCLTTSFSRSRCPSPEAWSRSSGTSWRRATRPCSCPATTRRHSWDRTSPSSRAARTPRRCTSTTRRARAPVTSPRPSPRTERPSCSASWAPAPPSTARWPPRTWPCWWAARPWRRTTSGARRRAATATPPSRAASTSRSRPTSGPGTTPT
mmetsp:Transcript_18656/g.58478  ORF Transcript_18656/g.58478 Transcript_18656/m.58478 type:complete len:202 (-) Transcript_18656:1768-2373(-)